MGVAALCCGGVLLEKGDGIMRKEDCLEVMKQHYKKTSGHGTDTKHISKVVTKWFKKTVEKVEVWPSESPDLKHAIKHVLNVLEKHV